jgi:hypothetical protein
MKEIAAAMHSTGRKDRQFTPIRPRIRIWERHS